MKTRTIIAAIAAILTTALLASPIPAHDANNPLALNRRVEALADRQLHTNYLIASGLCTGGEVALSSETVR